MRNFSARETEWLQELDGIELAGFWQRAIAITIDGIFILLAFSLLATLLTGTYLAIRHFEGKPLLPIDAQVFSSDPHKAMVAQSKLESDPNMQKFSDSEVTHVVDDVMIPILYFGILLWKGKGRTPGKRIMRIRVVSLMHRHITFWHSVERALGYGAAALELGFGFAQFFIHPYRRCAQDRLAETIVVTERSYQQFQHKLSHPLIADGSPKQSRSLTKARELAVKTKTPGTEVSGVSS